MKNEEKYLKDMSKVYSIYKPIKSYDYILFFITIALLLIGLFWVFSSSEYFAVSVHNRSTYFFEKQLVFALIGLFAMFIGMHIDFHHLKLLTRPMMYLVVILLFATYVPAFGGITVNGANSWLELPIIHFRFQPSELAKIALILFVANVLANPEYKSFDLFDRTIVTMPIIGTIGIIVFQPDMGNTAVISMAIFTIYFVSGLSINKIFGAIIVLGAGALAMIISNPYQMDRVTNFINPWSDPSGKGFQLIQSLIAIGSGGISGTGLGQSVQKLFYLPESHTDFIFAVFCEETGFFGAVCFLILMIWLAKRGYGVALKSKDLFIKYLATGITSLIFGQAVMNIGVVIGILPTTGITLPFVSYGGTSLVITLFCMGLLINASKYTTISNWVVVEGKE